MRFVASINQNIPVWSVIKGDHACTDHKKLLNATLLKNPDFMDPRENALRKTFLQTTSGRKWLHDLLDQKSFGVYQLEQEDLEKAVTVWKRLPLLTVAKQYRSAYKENRGIEYKTLTKDEDSVVEVRRRQQRLIQANDSLDWLTKYEEAYDYHRCIWIKRREESILQVIDGTHRTIATTWRYLLNRGSMPKQAWYAVVCVE